MRTTKEHASDIVSGTFCQTWVKHLARDYLAALEVVERGRRACELDDLGLSDNGDTAFGYSPCRIDDLKEALAAFDAEQEPTQ